MKQMLNSSGLASEHLGCPNCLQPLCFEVTLARCVACGAEFPLEEGVLCTNRTDVFMGEFDAQRMKQYTHEARELGWRRTVEEEMGREDPGARAILLGPERASFIDLLHAKEAASVLDLGAGMGAISLQLEKSFRRVYSVDQTFERLAFLSLVAEQEQAQGIQPICHRDVFRLPFLHESLDAAIMIGVFEYFPASYPEMSVAQVQARALAELYRVLKPGAPLFVATKNRFGWPYWSGAKDNSGLRFGSLMPRWLANRASLIFLRRPYRIVTDSYWGYSTLLRNAGFIGIKFFWPDGGYQAPKAWVDLSDAGAVGAAAGNYGPSRLKRGMLRALAAIRATAFLVPHFGIVAKKPD